MLEFVRVVFADVRDVIIDHVRQGSTGETLIVSRGNHLFHLGEPKNYRPASVTTAVVGTSSDDPMIITFTRVPALAATPAAMGPAGRSGPAPADLFAIASRNSGIYHSSQTCPAAGRIAHHNVLFGDEARQGRTPHDACHS